MQRKIYLRKINETNRWARKKSLNPYQRVTMDDKKRQRLRLDLKIKK